MSGRGESLLERWLDWRNGLLRKPSFIRFASRFPLTRPMARARTRDLFDLAAGFVYTQILTTLVRTGALGLLADGPMRLERLAEALAMSPEATGRLMKAGVALELVDERSDGRYGLGELGAALLGNPGVIAMIHHHALLYEDLRDPEGLLRDPSRPTALSRYWGYAMDAAPDDLPAESVAPYSELMAASQDFICEVVLDAYPIGRHARLLDIGGGEGRFAEAAMARAPGLQATVFDLPAVAERARGRFAARGLADRGDARGGDFFADSLPQGFDAVSLVRVLHDHDDDKARLLLRQARSALPQGGTILVAEPLAGTRGAEKAGDAYFGFYLLAMRSGRPRTAFELEHYLAEAGFGPAREHRSANPLLTRVFSARAL